MSLAKLADLASLSFPRSQEPIATDGLWTSRNPVFFPPSPFPGQDNVRIPNNLSSMSLPRDGIRLCASESGDVYLYGGVIGGESNELYHYSATDNTVTPLQCRGASPGSRADHAMAMVGNVIAIHGGDLGRDPDLYLLNLVSREWSRISTSGSAPGHLTRHAMAVVGSSIYIFGGAETSWGFRNSNKIWAFNLDSLRTLNPAWELVEPSSQAQPEARCECTLVSYHDRLILFGGRGGSDNSNVWSFNTKSRSWSELQCTGDIPPSRSEHTAAMLDDVMYVIGGYKYGKALKGTFALKIPEQRWFKLRDTDATPAPRSDHASARTGTKICTFGGDLRGGSEKHHIHILDTKYIDNPNLHTPEGLRELDTTFQVMTIRAKSEDISEEKSEGDPQETERSKRTQIISHILESPSKMGSFANLQKTDAQMIVDLLADELGREDIPRSTTEKRRILHFLTKLAKSAQIFPKSTELSDVQCILTSPVNMGGGYGFIYKGVFRDQAVCVKAVRPIESDSTAGKMLRAQVGELVLLAHAFHPNVIPLFGAYLSSEEIPRACIVSPWMENGDLVAYLRKSPNAPKILLARDTAAGLDFLHGMGIIHADLKAKNVLVSRSQRAMLADFGVATILHTNVGTTTAGDFAGTTYWMAPEQLVALADDQPPPPTKESDMWGFACICYEMFTGKVPFFTYYKPMQLAMAFVKGRKITPLRPNQDAKPVSADGEPWVPLAEKCWNFDPSERPTATEAVRFLVELNVQDDRPSMDEELATFKAIKDSRVKVEIDYSRILSIVQSK